MLDIYSFPPTENRRRKNTQFYTPINPNPSSRELKCNKFWKKIKAGFSDFIYKWKLKRGSVTWKICFYFLVVVVQIDKFLTHSFPAKLYLTQYALCYNFSFWLTMKEGIHEMIIQFGALYLVIAFNKFVKII
jgi:hypothetical protein